MEGGRVGRGGLVYVSLFGHSTTATGLMEFGRNHAVQISKVQLPKFIHLHKYGKILTQAACNIPYQSWKTTLVILSRAQPNADISTLI
jgi:hypothetical protein